MRAAIAAGVKRGELMRFCVKQVESGHANAINRMNDEELEAFNREGAAELGAARRHAPIEAPPRPAARLQRGLGCSRTGVHQRLPHSDVVSAPFPLEVIIAALSGAH